MGSTTHYDGRTAHQIVTDEAGPGNIVARSGKYYAIKGERGNVYGCVVLSSTYRGGVSIKYVSEDMGPVENRCPQKVLDALSPLGQFSNDMSYAKKWREASAKYNARKAALPKVTPGTTVKFAEPLDFGNGNLIDTFTHERQHTFTTPNWDCQRVRLPRNWKTSYNWVVVPSPA